MSATRHDDALDDNVDLDHEPAFSHLLKRTPCCLPDGSMARLASPCPAHQMSRDTSFGGSLHDHHDARKDRGHGWPRHPGPTRERAPATARHDGPRVRQRRVEVPAARRPCRRPHLRRDRHDRGEPRPRPPGALPGEPGRLRTTAVPGRSRGHRGLAPRDRLPGRLRQPGLRSRHRRVPPRAQLRAGHGGARRGRLLPGEVPALPRLVRPGLRHRRTAPARRPGHPARHRSSGRASAACCSTGC